MNVPAIATFIRGTGPLVATAIHAGSYLRSSLIPYCGLNRAQRLREEDPFTEQLAMVSDNRIIGERSRFEVDLNRPRDKAIYRKPEDAWGLNVYNNLPVDEYEGSLNMYDAFYEETGRMMDALFLRHEQLVVFDIHSYNHQREGEGIFADTRSDPDVNIGTGNLDRNFWGTVVDKVIQMLSEPLPSGKVLDVRENVKFKGGYFSKWLHQRYGTSICTIAIEYKKIFMNEWTGEPDLRLLEQMREQLERTALAIGQHVHGQRTV